MSTQLTRDLMRKKSIIATYKIIMSMNGPPLLYIFYVLCVSIIWEYRREFRLHRWWEMKADWFFRFFHQKNWKQTHYLSRQWMHVHNITKRHWNEHNVRIKNIYKVWGITLYFTFWILKVEHRNLPILHRQLQKCKLSGIEKWNISLYHKQLISF